MPVFLLKSFLSLLLLGSGLAAVFTMFALHGHEASGRSVERMRRLHRLNGYVFTALSLVVAFLCLQYIFSTKVELSPRGTLHAALATAILGLLAFKIAVSRRYRHFYPRLDVAGFILALVTFVTIVMSAGYYLLVTRFGSETLQPPAARGAMMPQGADKASAVRTDSASIGRGKELYGAKCAFCHDITSKTEMVGPGHRGIMKNPLLPVSKRPSTPGNIAFQLRHPYKDMPSFSYLTDDEIQDVIAYLNTL